MEINSQERLHLAWDGHASLRANVSYFLLPAEKGRLRNGVANRVPVSCCSGFKFRTNYDNSQFCFLCQIRFPLIAPWSEVEQD